MRKAIDFPPYTVAEVKAVNEDESVLCDLYGDRVSDTNIVFPAGSEILNLTEEEKAVFEAEQLNAVSHEEIV